MWVNRVISIVRQSLPLSPQELTFGCNTISVATALFASSIVQGGGNRRAGAWVEHDSFR